MLQYVSDDIFASPAQTLVNTVNTVGVMGKGIAAEFKRRFPEMFVRYERHCREGTLTVGRLYLYRSPHKWVLNFPTKQHWRNPSRIEWIEAGLKKFVESYESQGITSIAFPQLGCGNGGLDWAAVKPLMNHYLALPIPVFVHTRIHAPDFVPEHEPVTHGKDLSTPRTSISFSDFIADLMQVLGQSSPSNIATRLAAENAGATVDSDPLPPPPRVPSSQGDFDLSWSSLEVLWSKLVRRGALALSDFPELDPGRAAALSKCMRRLDYIQSMNFISGNYNAPKIEPGIRYAPPAEASASDLWRARATYTE